MDVKGTSTVIISTHVTMSKSELLELISGEEPRDSLARPKGILKDVHQTPSGDVALFFEYTDEEPFDSILKEREMRQ